MNPLVEDEEATKKLLQISSNEEFEGLLRPSLRDWLRRRDDDAGIWEEEVKMNTTLVYGFNDRTKDCLRPLFEAIHASYRKGFSFGVNRLLMTEVRQGVDPLIQLAPPTGAAAEIGVANGAALTLREIQSHALFLRYLLESLFGRHKPHEHIPFVNAIEVVNCYFNIHTAVMNATTIEEGSYFGLFLTKNPIVFNINNDMIFLMKAENVSKMPSLPRSFDIDMESRCSRFYNYIERPYADDPRILAVINKAPNGKASYVGIKNALKLYWDVIEHGGDWLMDLQNTLKPLVHDMIPILWEGMAFAYRDPANFFGMSYKDLMLNEQPHI